MTLPLMASKVFHGWIFHNAAYTYGVMASVMGVGAVVGGLISTARSKPGSRTLCVAAVGWGIAILAAAVAPDMPLELVALVFVGYGSITFNSFAKISLQLAAKPTMRGRVMALWALAWLGSTPVGGPIVGWIGQDAGARWSLVVGGAATLICGVAAFPALTRIDRRRVAAEAAGAGWGGKRVWPSSRSPPPRRGYAHRPGNSSGKMCWRPVAPALSLVTSQ